MKITSGAKRESRERDLKCPALQARRLPGACWSAGRLDPPPAAERGEARKDPTPHRPKPLSQPHRKKPLPEDGHRPLKRTLPA